MTRPQQRRNLMAALKALIVTLLIFGWIISMALHPIVAAISAATGIFAIVYGIVLAIITDFD